MAGAVDGRQVLVGSPALLRERGVDVDPILDAAASIGADGGTAVGVAIDGVAAGLFAITDPVKAGSAEAVRDLRAAGHDVWLLTGDARATAEAVARAVGIAPDHVVAEVLPGGQGRRRGAAPGGGPPGRDGRRRHQRRAGARPRGPRGGHRYRRRRGDRGVGRHAGGGDPRLVGSAIALSRATTRVIRQNLFWAFAYNVVLIPVAMGVLYPTFGITINPAFAAGAMALSSVSVVTNSLRLRRVDVRPRTSAPPTLAG